MTSRILHLALPVLVAAGVATACSSKAPAARAFVSETITGGGGNCTYSSITTVLAGSDTSDGGLSMNPTRVPNGTTEGGTVDIVCSVAPSGSNFDIALSAELATSQAGAGGSILVNGTVDATTGAQSSIAGTFVIAGGVTFVEKDCTITYPTMPPGGPVAPGRIWGKIDCPNAVAQGQNASGTPNTCDLSALFVFEDCSS